MKTPLTLTDEYEYADTTYKDKFKLPMTYGFGVSVAPNENLTLAADVDIRPYSNTDYEDDYYDTTYSAEFENTTQFRVGLEYLIIGENSVFPVRLGFHTDPYIENPLAFLGGEKKVTGNFFTTGFGVIVGNIWIDAAYEFGMLKVEESDLLFSGDKWTYKEQNHNIIVSAIVHFE